MDRGIFWQQPMHSIPRVKPSVNKHWQCSISMIYQPIDCKYKVNCTWARSLSCRLHRQLLTPIQGRRALAFWHIFLAGKGVVWLGAQSRDLLRTQTQQESCLKFHELGDHQKLQYMEVSMVQPMYHPCKTLSFRFNTPSFHCLPNWAT